MNASNIFSAPQILVSLQLTRSVAESQLTASHNTSYLNDLPTTYTYNCTLWRIDIMWAMNLSATELGRQTWAFSIARRSMKTSLVKLCSSSASLIPFGGFLTEIFHGFVRRATGSQLICSAWGSLHHAKIPARQISSEESFKRTVMKY